MLELLTFRNMLYLVAAFAVVAMAAASASDNNKSLVLTNNQENNKINANIPVVVVLKEQPLHKVSSKVKKEHRKRLKEITKSAKEIYSRIKPLTGSEEELRAKNISELVAIEQSLLTEKEKLVLAEVGKNLESNVTQMRREILAQTAPLTDKGQKTIINKIRAKGGSVKYSSKVFNAIAADIPVSYIEELSKEEGVYKIYHDHVLNEDLDVSTGAMAADNWWSSGYTGANLDVAVIDSGIDGTHPALTQSVHYAGVFHDTAKTNSSYADNSSSTDDLRGHGTHVAGIVASMDPRYKGVAYGSKLINAKAGWLEKNGTAEMYESDAMKAIDWAIFGNPDDADVISFSFGNGSTNGDSSFEHFMDAVAYELDTPVAKSAGNGGPGGGTITDPGGAFNVITVGNVDDKNTVSRADDFLRLSSSRGPAPDGRIKPDISAPGTFIMSAAHDWEGVNPDFVSKTGTSMAAPHIAGSIILLLNYKYYQTEAIKALLLNTAEDRGVEGPDSDYGFGYVDLSHAYIHRDDVFAGSVADRPDGSVEKYFKGNASIGDKATLVWNRHVDYINSSYPTSYLNISNLDLYMYDEVSGGLVSSSTSGINNVEQVKSKADYTSVVLKIEPYEIFPDGISTEDYALAAEEGFSEESQPGLNITINNPGSVASGTNFNMDVTATSTGGIAAHNVNVTITLPSGFTIISGANPQLVGTVNAGSSMTATWVVQVPDVTSSTPYSLEASANSYSYGDAYSDNISTNLTIYYVQALKSPGAPSIISFAPPLPVSNIANETRTFNITINQAVNVTWYLNGTQFQFNKSITQARYTNTSARPGTWNITAIAQNANGTALQKWEWNVITIMPPYLNRSINTTANNVTTGNYPAPIKPAMPGSGGGGGGGGASGENFSNVIVREKYDEEIFKDKVTSYKFKNASNPITHVNVTGNVNAGLITAVMEVLEGTSVLVKEAPPGVVNKNVNLWLGTSGFATPRNLKEVVIRFRVENGWIKNNNVDAKDITLLRWDGARWMTLSTKVKEKDTTNTYFEATTNSLSPLAISAVTVLPEGPAAGGPPAGTQPLQEETSENPGDAPRPEAPGFEIVAAIVALGAMYIIVRNIRR